MNAPALVLLCDHRSAGLSRRARVLTEAGFAVELSGGLRASLELLAGARPALVVVDPLGLGAVELDALLAAPGAAGVPFLVVCSEHDALAQVLGARLVSRGLWDVLRRDAPDDELALRLERLRDAARALREMDEWRHRATHDDRTQLLRPLEFSTALARHVSAAQRHALDLALLLIDLDRFGQINKHHDHTVGDRVIERVGTVIRAALRVEDVAGRLGGDEFAVLLPYTKKVDAASVVVRLLSEIAALSGPLPGAQGEVRVSASIGFETFDGADLDSGEALRQHAEAALRQAKRRGGDQGVYFRDLIESPPPAERPRQDDAGAQHGGPE